MKEGIEIEESFVEDCMDVILPACECGSPDCVATMYQKKGEKAVYRVEFDASGDQETNLLIRVDTDPVEAMKNGLVPVVFSGLCKTNMDFAKILTMCII